jgi:AcrR family transcriptional regulator
MSSEAGVPKARAPKRARGKQRVAELLQAAAEVFAEKGYEAATMTEIAARAGAPIGSLYQFFPVKEVLADWLVQNYIALLVADLKALEERASRIDTETLVDNLLGLLYAHERGHAAATPLVEARMDERTRRTTLPPHASQADRRDSSRALPFLDQLRWFPVDVLQTLNNGEYL